jgi:hypothetical protein
VVEPLAAEGVEAGAHRLDVVAQPRPRRVELHAVAALDVGPHLGAQAQPEAPAGGLGELPGGLGVDHGAARERHRDPGADVEVAGERGSGARQVGGAARLGDHQPVEPGLLGVVGQLLHRVQGLARHHHVHLHACSLSRGR